MDKKRQFMFRLVIGVVVITAVIFLSFKYLLKGPPFIKVLAIGLIAATGYLVVDNLIKKSDGGIYENKKEKQKPP